jgi:choline dehydrogenase-like flavoprotein
MHPTIKATARFKEPINSLKAGVPVHQVKEFAPRISLGCSISTLPHLATALADHPERRRTICDDWKRTAVYYAMTCGGSGTVRNLPLFRDPIVRYRFSEADYRDLADGLKKLVHCLLAAGAEAVYPAVPSARPWTNERGPADAVDGPLVASAALMTIHLFSSCPMGEDRSRCAVDSFGGVHDVDDLYVADASMLCGAPGVNPQGTILALARRNAVHFLDRRRPAVYS